MTHTAVRVLTTLADLDRADRTDGQLLDAFARRGDPAAFEALVRRHGPMVLGVCRRVLRNHADADDAFQAAFLVLARKAAALGPREVLAGFLHRVAFNTARRLRRANLRRAGRETPLAGIAEPAAAGDDGREELLAVLDEELSRLPDRYRLPVVLCDLEGATRREAAARLGWPEGTVAGRLARARKRLAGRLTARGVALAAGVVVVLPGAAVAGAVRAASGGGVPARVAELTRGVVFAMFAKKLRAVAAVVLTAGLVLAGAYRTATADPVPAAPPAARAEPIPPPKRVPAAELAPKKPTVIPLKKVDPEKAAKAIAEKYKEKGVTAAALPGEKAVLVYADEETTFYIEESLLLDLGEDPPKKVYAYRLAEGVDAVALAKAYAKPPTSITAVPVPSERLLLLYATRLEAKVLGPFPPDGQRLREPVPEKPAAEPKKYTVDFRGVPWADVLDWYAKESGLTPTFSVKPTGTVTIATPKNRQFTLVEVTDLINEALLSQKFLLVRRQVTFTIVPADEKIDPSQIPRVDLSDLSQRGKTELVQVLLPLKTLTVAEAAPEVSKMLTPFGTLSSLAKVNTLVITDTAGNITRIVQTLQKVEGGSDGDVLTHQFLYVKATDMAEKLKTLLTDATRVKPVAVIVDVKANSVTVTGPPEKIALAKRIIEETDKPQFPGQNPIRVDDPELRKYSVPRGTAEEVAKAVQASYPGVRVIALSSTDEIMVLGTAAEHAQLARQLKDLAANAGKKEPGKE